MATGTLPATAHVHTERTARDLFIVGDIVAYHRSHRICGTVATVGAHLINVVRQDGTHRAYRPWQIDLVVAA